MAYYTQYQPETRTIPTIFPSSSVGAHLSLPMAFSIERYSTHPSQFIARLFHSLMFFSIELLAIEITKEGWFFLSNFIPRNLNSLSVGPHLVCMLLTLNRLPPHELCIQIRHILAAYQCLQSFHYCHFL
jgi:hypothetical protein